MEIIEYKKEIEKDVEVYVSALPVKITSNESYLSFTNELKNIKFKLKVIEDRLKEPKQKAKASWQDWIDLEKELMKPLLEKEIDYKKEIVAWSTEQERIRKAEEDRLREIARKEEEERQIQAAIAAEQSGNQEEAQAIIEAPIQAAPVIVERTVPKVAGISMRENWKFRIVDEKKIPREFLKVDEVKIGGYVRSMKSAGNIPGVEIYNESTVGAGRRAA
jgi:hypothetical protein